MIITTNQKALQTFLKRRHPDYDRMLPHWEFLEATYNGGRQWFQTNIFRYMKEGDQEFKDRLERCYRFNHTREAVDLIQKYLFKSPVTRNHDDAPPEIAEFWKNATLTGLDVNQFMRLASTRSSVLGRIWIFTDTNKTADIRTVADEKAMGARVYAYLVKPQNILDMGFDDIGDLNWILVRETVRDDANPILSTGIVSERFRLWTRTHWYLFAMEMTARNEVRVRLLEAEEHGLGVVPAFPLDHVIGENRYTAPGLIDDIAYLDRAVANYLSNLDAIIQDQTFSQLAMPANAVLPGEEKYNKLVEMGTKRIFIYDGEGGSAPAYISPDPKQAGVIVDVIAKIINEIYHTIGLAGERTKQDNAVGIDNSSGVAKAYDFERVNSLLAAKAHSLENAENKLCAMVMRWNGRAAPAEELVKYPDNFDVRSLFDEFSVAEHLALIEAPQSVRRVQMEQVIEKLFPRLAKDLVEVMRRELESWPVTVETTEPPTSAGRASRNLQTENRQGEVTADSA